MITAQNSSTARAFPMDIIHGRNGDGKTIFSLTASSQLPDYYGCMVQAPPKDAPITTISDIIVLGTDRDALAGLEELKLNVAHYYDFSSLAPDKMLAELLDTIKGEVLPKVAKGDIVGVTLDTITRVNKTLADVYVAPAADGRGAWGKVSQWYGKLESALRQLQCHVQILNHPKYADGEDEAVKRSRMLKGIPEVSLRISGDGGQSLRNDARMILNLERIKQVPLQPGNKKQPDKVVVHTRKVGVETKLRQGLGLPDTVDADWRVINKALASAPQPVF